MAAPEGGWVHLTSKDFAPYGSQIPRDAFRERHDILSVEIPNNILVIGEYSFYCCINVRRILLPEHLKIIGHCSFEGCARLAKINFAPSIVEIGSCAFEDCTALAIVSIPPTLKTTIKGFGHCVFIGCPLLPIRVKRGWKPTGEFVADDLLHYGSGTEIPNEAFFMRLDIRSIEFPPHVTEIGIAAFYECFNLRTVTFPSYLEIVRAHAFQSCISLAHVHLPESVRLLEERAFYNAGITKTFVMIRNSVGARRHQREFAVLGPELFAANRQERGPELDGVGEASNGIANDDDGNNNGGGGSDVGGDVGCINGNDDNVDGQMQSWATNVVVSAPDALIALFHQGQCSSLGEASASIRKKASALQLEHYFWNVGKSALLTLPQLRFIFTVMVCGSRNDLLPDELLMHILSFLALNELA